jgi:hypothetical protein
MLYLPPLVDAVLRRPLVGWTNNARIGVLLSRFAEFCFDSVLTAGWTRGRRGCGCEPMTICVQKLLME